MSTLSLKKTLNLHKYSVRVNDFVLNWKIIIPASFAVTGLIAGCLLGKGEGAVYLKITSYFSETVMSRQFEKILPYFLSCLIVPSVFCGLIFFFGLSAYGGVFTNFFPFVFGGGVGTVSYYMYSTYTLKGLAYCVILIFPYAVLCMISIVLCTSESISMSDVILRSISKNPKFPDYSFKQYYTGYLKNYVYILLAAALKIVLDYLFGAVFNF